MPVPVAQQRKRIFVYGHSAGGHLAACLLAQDWKAFASDTPADLVPAAYAISGVFDLSPRARVAKFRFAPRRGGRRGGYRRCTGKSLPGARSTPVVSAWESSEFLRQSKIIAEGWRARGVAARYEEIAGMNHFTIVDALSDADSAMTRRVVELAQYVNAMAL